MQSTSTTAAEIPFQQRKVSQFGDRAFKAITAIAACSVLALILILGEQLYVGSRPTLHAFGWKLLIDKNWNADAKEYGALPFIYGTVVTSVIALLIAVPLSIATAVYLTDLAPLWLRQPVVSVIEMLAAVPSVIWGLWGIFVMVPWLRVSFFPVLKKSLGPLPVVGQLFQGPIFGIGYLSAGIIVAIMIIPIITAVSREILRSVPDLQREAAYGLGATRWEVTRIAVLSYARRGLFGAAVLGLGRALGETMAVTMVIGNSTEISKSLLAPGYTLASVIANEFGEAGTDAFYTSALFELGLILLGITILINIVALLMVRAVTSEETRRVA